MRSTIFLFLFVATSAFGQHNKDQEKQLNAAFDKTNYWASYQGTDGKINAADSALSYEAVFSKLLLKVTAADPETIRYNFDALVKNGMKIVTSEDGNFRIYSWDDQSGGTMRRYHKIFQFRDKKRVLSKSLPGIDIALYKQINVVVSQGKTFYVTQNISILSSALTYHQLKVFSIENGKLNDKAVLIKTKSGIMNKLGYEIDLSSTANSGQEVPDYSTQYDKKDKIFTIPLIMANGKVTNKKISYQFKGKYFEKL